jgi:hypothetical protein
MSAPVSDRPEEPGRTPWPVRALSWVVAAGVILVLPALLLGSFGWAIMTVWGLAIVGLSLVGLLNLAGERDRWRATVAFRRWDYATNHRGWPRVYPTFMQTTWYIVGGSFLMLLAGILFVLFGLTEVAR